MVKIPLLLCFECSMIVTIHSLIIAYMSLKSKSDENINLVGYAVFKQKYLNVAASRAYYSVFQLIKHFLKKTDFDYAEFVERMNIPDKRPFSHKTIHQAYFYRCTAAGMKWDELKILNLIGDLRYMRTKADYSEEFVKPKEVERCMDNAKDIIAFIEKRESEAKVD